MIDRKVETSPLLVERNKEVEKSDEKTSHDCIPETDFNTLNYARRLLYVSHFFAQFSETAWQFALVLLLAAFVHYKSLLLIATYGIVSNGTICLLSSYVGTQLIDKCSHQRLRTAQFFIWTENVCVIVASILCYILLIRSEANLVVRSSSGNGLPTDWFSIVLLVGIHFFGPVAQLLDQGFVVAMEKDWVVVMGQVAVKTQSSVCRKRNEFCDEADIHLKTELLKHQQQNHNQQQRRNEMDNSHRTNYTSNKYVDGDEKICKNKNVDDPKRLSTVIEMKNEWLINTNVTMKQIDLSCKVIAPAISGYIVDAFGVSTELGITNSSRSGLSTGAIFIGLVNVASLIAEYVCTAEIYRLIPELSYPTTRATGNKETIITMSCTNDNNSTSRSDSNNNDKIMNDVNNDYHKNKNNDNDHCNKLQEHRCDDYSMNDHHSDIEMNQSNQLICKAKCYRLDCNQCHSQKNSSKKYISSASAILPPSIVTYFQQSVSYAGLGQALLYLNALSFGGLMVSYLLFRGMSISTVGFWRGLSSIIGLLGTVAYQQSTMRYSLITTGTWSILFQFVCITASMVSMYVEDYTMSMMLFIAGVCTSRIGLYVYKITVTQLMQQNIPASIRGNVGGTQNSLNAFFQLASFVLCSIFPNPKDFVIVVGAGYIAVAIAAGLYIYGIFVL